MHSVVTKKHNFKRILGLSLAILIGLPLLFFALVSGQQLFANAQDEIPHDVVVSDITKSSAVVTWLTDQEAQAVVEYGVSPNALNLYAPEPSPREEHSVELTLLTSSTTYYFQIKVGDRTYDNGGMPWTFTTKSQTGEDVSDEVRGISTRISKASKDSVTSSKQPLVCNETTCDGIQKKLGKGCTSSDYLKCLAAQKGISGSPSPTPGAVGYLVMSPSPQPTSVLIKSELCRFNYLQSVGTSCSKWNWGDSMDVQEPTCKKAFYRYVLECKRKDFSTSGGDIGKWAIYDIGTISYTIDEDLLLDGDTIYCRIRAEDKDGNAGEWQNNIEPKKCQ